MRKRVFIHSEDAELAVQLVKLLDRHGITGFWVISGAGGGNRTVRRMDARVRQDPGHRWRAGAGCTIGAPSA